MPKKPKIVLPASPGVSDTAAAAARNKRVARIGDTPLAVGGVLRNGRVEGLEPSAYNMRGPGKNFIRNAGSFEQQRVVGNDKMYSASLPKRNAIAIAKKKKGA